MKTLKEIITQKLVESIKPEFVNGPSGLIKLLKKDPSIKSFVMDKDLYFDDADLVINDKTAVFSPIGDDGSINYDEIVAAVKETAKKIDDELASLGYGKPKKDETQIGRFNVVLPKEMKGVHGGKNIKIETPRAIVTASDDDSLLIKKELHSSTSGVSVRIMKRSSSNKVYIDAKTEDGFNDALTKLSKI